MSGHGIDALSESVVPQDCGRCCCAAEIFCLVPIAVICGLRPVCSWRSIRTCGGSVLLTLSVTRDQIFNRVRDNPAFAVEQVLARLPVISILDQRTQAIQPYFGNAGGQEIVLKHALGCDAVRGQRAILTMGPMAHLRGRDQVTIICHERLTLDTLSDRTVVAR